MAKGANKSEQTQKHSFSDAGAVTLTFAEAERPAYKDNSFYGYTLFGYNHSYPKYLLKLFNESAKHGAIVKAKINYICGRGWTTQTADIAALEFTSNINPNETIEEVNRKCVTDLELYGGYYLQIIWSKLGGRTAEIYHMEYTKVATNKDNTQFWYKDDWSKTNEKAEPIPAFNPNNRIGRQILFVKEHYPECGMYSLPDYFNALNHIAADVEIGKHIYTNSKNGFSASKLISVLTGDIEDEDRKRALKRQFINTYSGADGDKVMLEFLSDPERKTTIQDIGQSDISREDFTNIDLLIQQNIYSGHQITNPALFGIQTTGKLGNDTDKVSDYEMFKNVYVQPKQKFQENIFNYLASFNGINTKLSIVPTKPVGIILTEQTLLQIAPLAYLREEAGIDMSKYPEDAPTANSVTTNVSAPQPPTIVQQHRFSEDDTIQVFSEFGIHKKYFKILKSHSKFNFSEEDENNAIVDASTEFTNLQFSEVNQLQADMLGLIANNKRVTPIEISKTLDIDIHTVNMFLDMLRAKGLLNISEDANGNVTRSLVKPLKEVTDAVKPRTTSFMMRYSYEWKPEVPIDQRNTNAHPSRPFCAKLMELDRLYTRSEIEQISARLGYSVFDRAGGWWTEPSGQHSPSCRHEWAANIVKRN